MSTTMPEMGIPAPATVASVVVSKSCMEPAAPTISRLPSDDRIAELAPCGRLAMLRTVLKLASTARIVLLLVFETTYVFKPSVVDNTEIAVVVPEKTPAWAKGSLLKTLVDDELLLVDGRTKMFWASKFARPKARNTLRATALRLRFIV